MYSYEDRMRAVQLYIRYGKRTAPVIRELGYPSRKNLPRWYRAYIEAGDLPKGYCRSSPRYSVRQKEVAVEYYMSHGRSLAVTSRVLGYPSRGILASWVDELRPGTRRVLTSTNALAPFAPEQKRQAVSALCDRQGAAWEVAGVVGVSRPMLYKWKDQLLGYEAYRSMRKRNVIAPDDERVALLERIAQIEQRGHHLQLEYDILIRTNDLIKKDQGISSVALTNREKTQVVDALRDSHPLPKLLDALGLARSSYFYHRTRLRVGDKYEDMRSAIIEIFNDNHRCYGYRRVHATLRRHDTCISEKVVRKLMAQEALVIHRSRRRHYSSYCGEIGPAPENLLDRDFHANEPNQKWLTDITEFKIPAGKVYLSPIIDCFDGKVVSWSIGTRPDAQLVNSMLDTATSTLIASDRPVIHSDRGGHYRWPGWLQRIKASGLVRSMSRKGCSPDNAACEGFFGRLKNEMYYCRNWANTTIDEFMQEVDSYIRWYNERRIKLSLGALSPMEYRQHLGLTV
ncbi:IS3 family transposase [Pseudomonas sp. NyZ704]|nr:IS3 family transposase [Pseudomonas sp. NyZ704]